MLPGRAAETEKIMLYALLAAVPFLLALVLMVGFKFSSGKSLIISLIATIILVLTVWKMDFHTVLAYFVYGALKSLDLLLIISGAILLLNTLKQTGIMQVINDGFQKITPDPRIQAIIIAYRIRNARGARGASVGRAGIPARGSLRGRADLEQHAGAFRGSRYTDAD